MSRKSSSPTSDGGTDWDALAAMTDEDINRAIAEDPDTVSAEELGEPYRVITPPLHVDVRAIRKAAGLSQAAFADRYGFTKKAVQNWEQGIRTPERSARILLWMIDKHPSAVSDALAVLKVRA